MSSLAFSSVSSALYRLFLSQANKLKCTSNSVPTLDHQISLFPTWVFSPSPNLSGFLLKSSSFSTISARAATENSTYGITVTKWHVFPFQIGGNDVGSMKMHTN
nr:uncharacterized protein LOC113722507 [Coffea arabica]